MKQGAILTVKKTFGFKNNGKGRMIVAKEGQQFWVTSSEVSNKINGYMMIDRINKGHISCGYAFDIATIEEWFEIEG